MPLFVLFLLLFSPAWAEEKIEALPQGVLFPHSKASIVVKGHGPFVEDLINNPLYGNLLPELFGEATGPTFTEEDHKAALALECEANDAAKEYQDDELVKNLMNIAYSWHKKNQHNPLGPGRTEDPKHRLENLANRQTAGRDLTYALDYLLGRIGVNTRIIMVADKLSLPANISELKGADFPASHITLEYFSSGKNKWLLLDPLIDYAPEISAFELYADPVAMQELNQKHGHNYYNPEGGLSLLLPDPDIHNQLEILWQARP